MGEMKVDLNKLKEKKKKNQGEPEIEMISALFIRSRFFIL